MNRKFWLGKLPLAILLGGAFFAAVAWQGQPGTHKQTGTDTVPKQKKVKDVDEALIELEKGRLDMERSLQNLDLQKMKEELRASMQELDKNLEKMKADLDQQMKQVDREKIKAQVEQSLKSIDAARMQADLEKELATIDKEKIKADIERSLKEIDAEKIRARVDASLSKIDWEKMKADMEKLKDTHMKQIEEELKNMGPRIEESMANARVQMEKAAVELRAYKGFIDGLEQDGLISKKEEYKIEWKNGELSINGKKQPASVVEKYSSFLKDRKDFTINKSDDDFNIHKD